ncbi:MAG TPA: hypothetical protein VNK94_00280 [Gaiellaceae bacterium]|nr:hypothetical protein [Gaiellaceae bacterium]
MWRLAPAAGRYERMRYRRCGRSGLVLPAISLGPGSVVYTNHRQAARFGDRAGLVQDPPRRRDLGARGRSPRST